MVEVRRKNREAILALIRRFSLKMKKSGVLNGARKRQYFASLLSDKEKKEKALKKIEKIAQRYEIRR